MSAQMWYTKKDVLNDLTECMGLRQCDFSERYIVRGSAPPPPQEYKSDTDDEFTLLYGDYRNNTSWGECIEPDLQGITSMLRMVDTLPTEEDQISLQRIPKNEPNQHVIISKLNPNVEEFKPLSSRTNNENPIVIKSDKDSVLSVKNGESSKKDKASELKDRFVAASKENSINNKKDRNVAIAALLKLNTTPRLQKSDKDIIDKSTPSTVSPETTEMLISTSPKPVVLFTPEYFSGPSTSTPVDIAQTDKCGEEIKKPTEPLEKCNIKTPSPNQLLDSTIKESVEKVNKWLDCPKKSKPRAPAPHAGIIVFRKKDTSEVTKSAPAKKVEAYVTPQFVPSNYATELAKTFEERVKAQEAMRKNDEPLVDMWTKVEMELKARDEKIKQRLREQNQS